MPVPRPASPRCRTSSISDRTRRIAARRHLPVSARGRSLPVNAAASGEGGKVMSAHSVSARLLRAVSSALAVFACAAATPAAAQYPERNVTLIVPYGAGGGTDITARMLAKDLEAVLGKPVTVENRAGGGGWVGWGGLAQAAPDGYTIGYLNVPSMYAGYLDRQYNRIGNARQLHAADEPRARLQCLGGEGGFAVQDREGRGGGCEEVARVDQHFGLRRGLGRPSRHSLDAEGERHQGHHRASQVHRRRQDRRARRASAGARCQHLRSRGGGARRHHPHSRRDGAGTLAVPAECADLQGAGLTIRSGRSRAVSLRLQACRRMCRTR